MHKMLDRLGNTERFLKQTLWIRKIQEIFSMEVGEVGKGLKSPNSKHIM